MNRPSAAEAGQPHTAVPPGPVQRRDRSGVAILRLDGPDGNRMGPALVEALGRALAEAEADPGVEAIVLASAQRDFCAGAFADLPPPGPDPVTLPPVNTALAALCDRVAAAAKPVVAALRGRVAAGGLALALAARERIAAPGTLCLCPEPRLGRLPSGGGAVRLAWRIGAGPALELMTGPPVGADAALALGLVDSVTEGAVKTAVERARALADGAAPALDEPCPGLLDAAGFGAALAAARAALPHPLPVNRLAERWLIDSVEAAQLLPAEQALAFDRVRAEDAALRPEARMLAHLATAARRLQDTAPQAADGPVCVALGPEAAARWVPVLLHEGVSVVLLGTDRERLTETLEGVAEAQFAQVRAGRLSQQAATDDWTRIAGRLRLDPAQPPAVALTDAAHLDWFEAQLPPGLPLAVLDPPPGWTEGLADPGRALALLPALTRPVRLCELVARGGDGAVAESLAALALQLRLTPLVVQGGPVLTPLIRAAARAAARLRAAGVDVETLAEVVILPQGLAEGTVAETAEALPLPLERLVLLATVNEAMRLLAAGRVTRPSDLDLALVMGAGWPNWRGGPMAEADSLGPIVLRHEMRLAAGLDAAIWAPEPMLDELIRQGWRFDDLNRA